MFFNSFLMGDDGQGLTEYGLILVLFVTCAIVGLMVLGPKITSLFTDANNRIN